MRAPEATPTFLRVAAAVTLFFWFLVFPQDAQSQLQPSVTIARSFSTEELWEKFNCDDYDNLRGRREVFCDGIYATWWQADEEGDYYEEEHTFLLQRFEGGWEWNILVRDSRGNTTSPYLDPEFGLEPIRLCHEWEEVLEFIGSLTKLLFWLVDQHNTGNLNSFLGTKPAFRVFVLSSLSVWFLLLLLSPYRLFFIGLTPSEVSLSLLKIPILSGLLRNTGSAGNTGICSTTFLGVIPQPRAPT